MFYILINIYEIFYNWEYFTLSDAIQITIAVTYSSIILIIPIKKKNRFRENK